MNNAYRTVAKLFTGERENTNSGYLLWAVTAKAEEGSEKKGNSQGLMP